jgi:hypothetical protein
VDCVVCPEHSRARHERRRGCGLDNLPPVYHSTPPPVSRVMRMLRMRTSMFSNSLPA